jgi:hypothetical protein
MILINYFRSGHCIGNWECGYFTEEISRGFEQFYDNIGGVADSFANFWAIMAKEFKDFDSVLTTKKDFDSHGPTGND